VVETRRALIAGAGAAALAGLGYRAWDRGVLSGSKGPAYSPWGDWEGTPADGIKRPLRAAILASNPHDTQPWLFKVGENAITVFADRERHLGTFDPFRREMHLGLGAAIENFVLAARAFGLFADVVPMDGALSLSPNTSPIPAARVELTPMTAARDALFAAIPNRHTNRGPYRADQSISSESLHRLTGLVTSDDVRVAFVEDKHARGELGALIVEATERIIGDSEMSADSARWFRTGRRDINAHRDGVTVDTAGLSPLMTTAAKLLPDMDAKSADRYWLSMTGDTQVPTAPVFGIVLVRDRLNMRWSIEAGRAWQRLHLAATAEGLGAQPLNQPVEWIDRSAMIGKDDSFGPAIIKFSTVSGWEPTFIFRLGVAERAANLSPRRTLDEVLRT
jgi:nitroreductase